MKRYILMALTAICTCFNCIAENIQNIIINGDEVEGKEVATMTFDGNDVRVYFTDNSTETVNMDKVKIYFNSDATGVEEIKTMVFDYNGTVDDYLTVSGVPEMTGIIIYDSGGKLRMQARANDDVKSIYVGNLAKGVYTARAGNHVIKFVKK